MHLTRFICILYKYKTLINISEVIDIKPVCDMKPVTTVKSDDDVQVKV